MKSFKECWALPSTDMAVLVSVALIFARFFCTLLTGINYVSYGLCAREVERVDSGK
jgi:hypothetical protein